MSEREKTTPPLEEIYRELGAIAERLRSAPEWFRNAKSSIKIAALTQEVERLTHQASKTNDAAQSEALVTMARQHLDEVDRILGAH